MRRAACTVLALAGFLLAARAQAALAPAPDQFELAARLRWLEQHAQRYDALCIGSSRVYRSVVPRALERELASRGAPLSVFNLGIAGAEPHETLYYLRRALAAPGARFRLVLLEAWAQTPESPPGLAFSLRRVYWHRPREALLAALACLREPSWTPLRRAEEASLHLAQLAWRESSYGRGPELARALAGPPPAPPPWVAEASGYRALEDDLEARPIERRRKLMSDKEAVEREADLLREQRAAGGGSAPDLALARSLVRTARGAGAAAVLFVAPGNEGLVRTEELAPLAPVLAYQDPDAAPFLFDVDLRWDVSHLARAGAQRFSRLLAQDLAPLLRGVADPGRSERR